MTIRSCWLYLALAALLTVPLFACKQGKAGLDVNNSSEEAVYNAETGIFSWPMAAAAPTTGLGETPVALIGPGTQTINIANCYFHTQAALTHNASNFETLTVAKRTNGGSATTIAQMSTNTTDWVAFTNIALPLAATPEFLSPGDSVTFKITESGTGVQVPIGELACFTNIN